MDIRDRLIEYNYEKIQGFSDIVSKTQCNILIYSVLQKVTSIIVLYYKKFCKLSNMIFSIEKRFTNFDQRFSVLHSCNSYFVSSEQNFCEIEKLFKGRGQTN